MAMFQFAFRMFTRSGMVSPEFSCGISSVKITICPASIKVPLENPLLVMKRVVTCRWLDEAWSPGGSTLVHGSL